MLSWSKVSGLENCEVLVDSRYPWRWLDLRGDGVAFKMDGPSLYTDAIVHTAVNSTLSAGVVPGISNVITTAGADFDGSNIQAVGSQFKLESGKPAYYGLKFAGATDATQSDFLAGLCGVDTTLMAASSSHAIAVSAGGVFFSKLDAATAINFKSYQTSSENNTAAVGTMDTSAHIYEIIWDGATAYARFDGSLIASFASTLPTVVLTPSLNFRAGAAAANTGNLYWMRAFQAWS